MHVINHGHGAFFFADFTFSLVHSAYRYLRLIGNVVGHCLYRSIPKPANPSYCSGDVTVIVLAIENDVEQLRALTLSILACNPFEIEKKARQFATTLGDGEGFLKSSWLKEFKQRRGVTGGKLLQKALKNNVSNDYASGAVSCTAWS